MSDPIHVRCYDLPPVDLREVLRYAACRENREDVTELARWAADTAGPVLCGRVCWREAPIQVNGTRVMVGDVEMISRSLARHLAGCQRAVLFAATVGLELDRLIARYGRLSPARGLMLQALGAERIEALCDCFNDDVKRCAMCDSRPRFSPGYGDLPLSVQPDIFRMLDCSRHIGLYLNESLLMSPSKSVTALIGLGAGGENRTGCAACGKNDCTFRRGT